MASWVATQYLIAIPKDCREVSFYLLFQKLVCSPLSSQTLFIPQVPFPGLSLSLAHPDPLGKFISPEAPLLIISQLLEEADEQPWSMLPD